MSDKKARLAEPELHSAHAFTALSKLVLSRRESALSMLDAASAGDVAEYRFTNFTSVIVKPTDDGFFRELFWRVYGVIDLEAFRERLAFDRDHAKGGLFPASTDIESLMPRTVGEPRAAPEHNLLIRLCDKFGDRIIREDFCWQSLLGVGARSHRDNVHSLELYLSLVESSHRLSLWERSPNFASALSRFEHFDDQAHAAQTIGSRLRTQIGRARALLADSMLRLQAKAAKKKKFERLIVALRVIASARTAQCRRVV